MFDRIKKAFRKQPPKETWKETLRRLGKELVPLSGEAETLQGELILCIGNLTDEATRNGWMNWDEDDQDSISILRCYLPDPDVFPDAVCQQVDKALDAVFRAGEGTAKGDLALDELTFLAQHVAEWCLHFSELEYKNPERTWLDRDPFQESENL